MAFTEAEKVNIRRWCGYGAFGGGQPLPASGYRFATAYGAMEYRMNTLGPEEEAVARTTYLANLATLETGIVGAAANLDTAAAAVWTRNPREVQERTNLFNKWRRDFCGFLGIPPGPALGDGCGISFVV